jgi:Cdc6-like AAA superfamily ATPase
MDNTYRIGESLFLKDKSYGDFDTLGFNTARGMFISIIKAVTPPLTIGLYGPWGSGKTTMISGMVEQLQKDNYLTLVFNAWQYRHEKNLILPLLCALQREHLSKFEDVKDSVKKVVTSVAVATLTGLLKQATGIGIGDIKTTLEIYENGYKHYKKYDDQVSKIEQEYKDFIAKLLQKTGKEKVVIFVDNLDRCLPDIAINLLEDISSFLSIRDVPCVYVLAMDKDNVINAIKHRFPDFDGSHYLEKIVQVPLKMPSSQQNSKGEGSAGRYHFMKRYDWGKMYEKVSSAGDSRDKVYKELASIDNIFGGDLLGNPRRIERIINKLMLLEATRLFDAEKNPTDVSTLIFLFLLAEYFPPIYDSLNNDSDFDYLKGYLQKSIQVHTSPFNKRKEREKMEPNSTIPNEVIFNAYCDDRKFFSFLKSFAKLSEVNDLPNRLKQIKSYLNYIG